LQLLSDKLLLLHFRDSIDDELGSRVTCCYTDEEEEEEGEEEAEEACDCTTE